MKKVGILTHYYNSTNYGGVLQSYALCRVLEDLGAQGEQVCYQMYAPPQSKRELLRKLLDVKQLSQRVRRRLAPEPAALAGRRAAFARFREELVPHSGAVYTHETIGECAPLYDAFVTGSDQVWNPLNWQDAYLLTFVPPDKPKFSYAASVSRQSLTEAQQADFRRCLAGYKGVSVREQRAVELLSPLSPVPVEQSLDPTMLLTAGQWEAVCEPRQVEGPYVFCFFLGEDVRQREVARAFAAAKGLPLVTLPYLTGTRRRCDDRFGDRRLFDVSPGALLSLIRHADYVLTDSFHASVFSGVYRREYFVFTRLFQADMSVRIRTLTRLHGSEDHFCDTPERLSADYLLSLPPIDYAGHGGELERLREQSLDYLRRMLG